MLLKIKASIKATNKKLNKLLFSLLTTILKIFSHKLFSMKPIKKKILMTTLILHIPQLLIYYTMSLTK